MDTQRLSVTTTDREFIHALNAQKFDGIRISHYVTDSLPADVGHFIGTYFISFGLGAASSLFASWFYDRIKRDPSHKTTINGIDVSGNPEQIIIIINNYCKQQKANLAGDSESEMI